MKTYYVKIESGKVTNRIQFEGDMPKGWAKSGDVWIKNDVAKMGWSHEIVEGEDVFEKPPAPDEPEPNVLEVNLTKRQVCRALISVGIHDADAFIEVAFAAIVDVEARAIALNDWKNAPYFDRSFALFNDADVLAAATVATGVTFNSDVIDGLWAVAVDYPK